MSRLLNDLEIRLQEETNDSKEEYRYSSDDSQDSENVSINSYHSDSENEEYLSILNEELPSEPHNNKN